MKYKDKPIRVDRQVVTMTLLLLTACLVITVFLSWHLMISHTRTVYSGVAKSIFANIFSTGVDPDNFSIDALITLENTGQYKIDSSETSNHLNQLTELTAASRLAIIAIDDSEAELLASSDIITPDMDEDYSHLKNHIIEASITGQPTQTKTPLQASSGRVLGFYQPLQNENGSVIAMLIVEFSATDCYQTLIKLISGALIILLTGAVTGILLARHRFLAISNLNHRNMHNIDQMTGFKNRNAFDLDLANINNTASYESLTIYYIDLNELKSVNDSQGHDAGDKYIEGMAEIIRESMAAGDIIYRVGGDEFCILSFTHVSSKARSTIKRFEHNLEYYNLNNHTDYSAAIGYAIFNQSLDADASATRARAEIRMYDNKKRMKNGQNQLHEEVYHHREELNGTTLTTVLK